MSFRTSVKYIVLRDESGKEFPILFPDKIGHKDVSDGVRGESRMSAWTKVDGWLGLVSGGFYDPATGTVGGKSESAKTESRPIDATLINAMLGNELKETKE